MLLPLQGALPRIPVTQGDALGYVPVALSERIHISVNCRINIIFPISKDSFAWRPVFFILCRWKITAFKTPVYEILRFPHHRWPGCLQSSAISVSCCVAIESAVYFLNTRIGNHVWNQGLTKRILNGSLRC